MSGYRCVNFTELCRLCSSAGSNNIQIFSDDSLQKKITECLPILLNEKDKLPKVICGQCNDYVQIFSEFRLSCSKAQKMLESCLNTSKLRNGGQVYIKDEIPTKKVLKPIQNPSPTKLIPNLCNIVTSTPTKQVKKNILTSPNQPDFLSSIMQAVGIQTNDDASDNTISFSQNIQPQQTMQNVPQYTLTLDGGTLKSGSIQYKIENTANLNLQPQTQIITKNAQDTQNHQTMSVDEFLKLSSKKKIISQAEEPKNKKPKFNLILQASPQKPKIGSQVTVTPAPKTFGTPSTLNTPQKSQIQIHNIEKILPTVNQPSPTKQLMVPIMVRNDGNRNADAAQIISQALTMSSNQSIENKPQQNQPFMFMKIQPNADGQLTLTPASTVQAPQHLQLSLSPQQLQQLSFQAPPQQQTPALTMQPQITVTQVPAQEQTDSQTQTPAQPTKSESQDEDEDSYENIYEEDFMMNEDSNGEESQEKTTVATTVPKPYIIKKATKSIKPSKKIRHENLTELQSVHQDHSDTAKKQLNQLTSFNTKRAESENAEKPSDLNLTVCDVCKKVFKRKEFLMQHLKSHIGLRPFKCDEPTCNKSFSRKEHLLRHVVSHTGKKQFNCDVCMKLFSRKDNLNKHRRIHPETGQQTIRHHCPTCSKGFAHRAALVKHQQMCNGKSEEVEIKEVFIKEEKPKTSPVMKKVKSKIDKKSPEAPVSKSPAIIQSSSTQQQPQIVTILQQPHQQQIKLKNEQQQPQQIILSMSQAQAMLQQQQQKGAVYTFPTNLILNANGAFMTNTGEVVGNFKFDNQ